jgi:hypothetical protein
MKDSNPIICLRYFNPKITHRVAVYDSVTYLLLNDFDQVLSLQDYFLIHRLACHDLLDVTNFQLLSLNHVAQFTCAQKFKAPHFIGIEDSLIPFSHLQVSNDQQASNNCRQRPPLVIQLC